MAEFLLALESEEIPAALQRPAAEALTQVLKQHLSALKPREFKPFWGPLRIGLAMTIDATVPASSQSERGPRVTAPEQAILGFLRKHGAEKADLQEQNGFWLLNREIAERSAASLLQEVVPETLWNFSWPKSMRWGKGSTFTWVRPLRRIIAILDGEIVPFSLARGNDDGHGLASGHVTQGHRFLAPELFNVSSYEDYRLGLEKRKVILEADARRDVIKKGIENVIASQNFWVGEDERLLEEVTGLTEWPLPMLGKIDARFMELPAEVMQVSMRSHQRYFATHREDGRAAPFFVFVANQTFPDHGTATITGNERVLRARFADAWHFWTLDRRVPLESRVSALNHVTFHKALGSVGARVQRMEELAGLIARELGLTEAERRQAQRAALLAKADLTTNMVGEFPELQGIIGGYYAHHDGEDTEVASAINAHYRPRGLYDDTPESPVAISVALAERFDILAGFFAIDEVPTGSGDPYALRRAALGIIRIIRDRALHLDLRQIFSCALKMQPVKNDQEKVTNKLIDFLTERLRIQLRSEGQRHDVLTALITPLRKRNITDLLNRMSAFVDMIETDEGRNLLAASKRAVNIVRIENHKDGPHDDAPDPTLFTNPVENALYIALEKVATDIDTALKVEDYRAAMEIAATLGAPLDQFFSAVTVNDSDPACRVNRLRLLNRVNGVLSQIADFSEIQS